MKFLICGIGSIGQRHYKNLQSLGHEVAVCRSGKGGYNEEFIKKFFVDEDDAGRPITVYTDVFRAIDIFAPDGVFICTPNHTHIELALVAAGHGKHLFIEKPLSHNLHKLKTLQFYCRKANLVTMIGYNFRFDPVFRRLTDTIGDGASLMWADVSVHENIADWHPWEKYEESYACWTDKGGGVVLCYSHEIDMIYLMFGKPTKIHAVGGKITPVNGDAEDMVKVLFEYPRKDRPFFVSLHMDYWRSPARHEITLQRLSSPISWDYTGRVRDRDEMFLTEVKEFISAIEEKRESAIPLSQGRDVLEICLEIKKQIANDQEQWEETFGKKA